MELIADLLLTAGALGAAFYCFILGRKLNKFNSLENGVGGAVAVLSAQVDDLKKVIEQAQKTAETSAHNLTALTSRAEETSRKLELQMASLHDIPNLSGQSPPDVALNEAVKDNPDRKIRPDKAKPSAKQSEPMFMRHHEVESK